MKAGSTLPYHKQEFFCIRELEELSIRMKAGSTLQYQKAGRNSSVSESWKTIFYNESWKPFSVS
jgi:hypothetical protein